MDTIIPAYWLVGDSLTNRSCQLLLTSQWQRLEDMSPITPLVESRSAGGRDTEISKTSQDTIFLVSKGGPFLKGGPFKQAVPVWGWGVGCESLPRWFGALFLFTSKRQFFFVLGGGVSTFALMVCALFSTNRQCQKQARKCCPSQTSELLLDPFYRRG